MPRQLRLQYPGAVYHVMNRGDRREEIFRDDADRERFLATLSEACGKTEWQVHAYCLMSNHFHLVIETPLPNLVAGMKWLLGVYTKRFNLRHKECGHLFAGRYKALVVEGSGNGYLRTVCDYVHLNPVRAKLLRPGDAMESFRWSSYADYLKPGRQRPAWLRVDRLLGEKRIPKDSAAGRREFAKDMEGRRAQDLSSEFKPVERGWWLGSQEFRQELLAAAAERIGATNYGTERRETEEAKAQRLVRAEMDRIGWTDEELRRAPKGDKRKVRIAARLRRETTMSLKWIAARLAMGSWTRMCPTCWRLSARRPRSTLQSENRHLFIVHVLKWLLGVYTKRFNLRHKECGHLFAWRYKALVVEGSGNGYLRTVCDYVHLNPVRAKLLRPGDAMESFRWSSYADYLKPGRQRPSWLRVDRLLGEKRIPKDSAAGRREEGVCQGHGRAAGRRPEF